MLKKARLLRQVVRRLLTDVLELSSDHKFGVAGSHVLGLCKHLLARREGCQCDARTASERSIEKRLLVE
jgi:hypothetical protein